MRAVSITVHNNQKLEIFVKKREENFELWMVGPIKGRRMVLDHHLTHDDIEVHLEYAQPGDLVWRDASLLEIPDEKHESVIEKEKAVKEGSFRDYIDTEEEELDRQFRQAIGCGSSSESNWSVTLHLVPSIGWLTTDRKETNVAKKAMLGQWTDGVVTMSFEPDHKLGWSCTDPLDPLGRQKHAPDWWNFTSWDLTLMNDEHGHGEIVPVLHVDDQELHLLGDHRHRMVRVFHRIKTVGEHVEEASERNESLDNSPRERASHAAGETTPLLRQLEQALIKRNPLLAERLNPGLPESEIREALDRAKVSGDIEVLAQFYSWSNGTALGENDAMDEVSFFPQDPYRFMDLEEAIGIWHELTKAVETLEEMTRGTREYSLFSGITGQFFPILRNSGAGTVAVDLTPSRRNRVMLIDFEIYGKPVQAYRSFTSFIKGAVRANKKDDNISCL